MAYQEPKTDWSEADTFKTTDTNRIESNIEYLAGNGGEQQLGKTDDVEFNNIVATGDVDATGNIIFDEASGRIGTFTGSIVCASVNTGQGSNELYQMDQNVKTNSNVTFNNIEATGGLEVDGKIEPTSSPASGSYSDTVGTGTVIPRGIYDLQVELTKPDRPGSTATALLEKNIDSAWVAIDTVTLTTITTSKSNNVYSGVFSDGTNLRIIISEAGGVTSTAKVYYNRY